MDIFECFLDFKFRYSKELSNLDGLNGDCCIYAKFLYEYFNSINKPVKIFMMNKGVHFWVEVDKLYIDCRGVFFKEAKLLANFSKYVTKLRIQLISIDYLNNYILKKNNTKKAG